MTLTIKESSPLDSLTKPGSTAGSSDSTSNQNSRSNPVCLEVAVTIRSLPGEKGEPSSGSAAPMREEARTVIVFDNGAVLRLGRNLPAGQAVILSNPQGRDVVCRVFGARNIPTIKGYIEVEFLEPVVDFWGIHKTGEQSNAPNPPGVVVKPPQVVTQPQNVPNEPPASQTAPARVAPTAPVLVVPAWRAPSLDDIAGAVSTSPTPVAQTKVPESTPRISASRNADESTRDTVPAFKPFTPANAPVVAVDPTPHSSTWEETSAPARKPSTSNDVLGKFSASNASLVSSSSESRGKTPLIIAGAAVFLIGLGTGLFFMHRGSSASPSAAPIAAASQTTTPDLPAPTSVRTPPVVTRATEEEVPPSAPVPTPVSEVPIKESAVAPPPPAPQSVRRAASTPEVNQPDHVDMRQPDRSAQRSLPIHDLKMSAPTVESRSGRLVDASVPNIGDAPTTSAAIGAPGGGLIPPISRTNNPPAPPVPVVGLGSSGKTATEPKLISSTRPMYPQLAKQGNVEGDVVVSADIDATGKVAGAKVVSGPMYLRQAAVDAVQNWKYEPAMLNGRPTSAQITIKIQFRLK